jgi:hypothetical protein
LTVQLIPASVTKVKYVSEPGLTYMFYTEH